MRISTAFFNVFRGSGAPASPPARHAVDLIQWQRRTWLGRSLPRPEKASACQQGMAAASGAHTRFGTQMHGRGMHLIAAMRDAIGLRLPAWRSRAAIGHPPVFHQQAHASASARHNGEPPGDLCGALALAHMTGQAPQWPQLHGLAVADGLLHDATGQFSDARRTAVATSAHTVAIHIEHLQLLLAKNQFAFDTLTAIDPDDIRRLFTAGHACNGVIYGYLRPGGTVHFAALKKDASGQWWDMDSVHDQPERLTSPFLLLKRQCQREILAGRGFDLIYTKG